MTSQADPGLWTSPEDLNVLVAEMHAFVDREIVPLEEQHPAFFDHRREWARTDWENGGVPRPDWRELMQEARRRADRAGFYRLPLPRELGGREVGSFATAILREELTHRGPGLHAELQHEASIVCNSPLAAILHSFGTAEQKAEYLEPLAAGSIEMGFGLSEPGHGSDATHLETTATRDGHDWVIDGTKRWNSAMDVAIADLVFAQAIDTVGRRLGITAFLVPVDTPGVDVSRFHWTFNMPTDHAEVVFDQVRVPGKAVLGEVGRGMLLAQTFVHENRIRQAAASLGAAQYCIDESVRYARERVTFGEPLATRQGVQFPLAELHTEAELVRNTVRRTAWEMDRRPHAEVTDLVSMANVRANRLACEAADLAMQVHGGLGYSRHKPFEFIYRHHRRYRITEGTDEIQLRRIAGRLFGFTGATHSQRER